MQPLLLPFLDSNPDFDTDIGFDTSKNTDPASFGFTCSIIWVDGGGKVGKNKRRKKDYKGEGGGKGSKRRKSRDGLMGPRCEKLASMMVKM